MTNLLNATCISPDCHMMAIHRTRLDRLGGASRHHGHVLPLGRPCCLKPEGWVHPMRADLQPENRRNIVSPIAHADAQLR